MDDLEKAFLNNPGDAYAIYQLKHTQDTRDLRFASMSQVMTERNMTFFTLVIFPVK